MVPEKEIHETPKGFPSHFQTSHSIYLGGVEFIPNVINDMRLFRSAVCQLPPNDIAEIISGIQEVCRIRNTHNALMLTLRALVCSAVHRSLPNGQKID